jgi:pimeloyl-ACP methyl ester carboxylesterase
LRPTASIAEVGRCYASLARPEARRALLHTLRSVVDAGGQRVSATDRLPLAADIPTLIVWGERDGIIPVTHAHDAHEAIPGSRLEIFPDTGHFPQAEQPERFVRTLTDFMRASKPASLSEERMRVLLGE